MNSITTIIYIILIIALIGLLFLIRKVNYINLGNDIKELTKIKNDLQSEIESKQQQLKGINKELHITDLTEVNTKLDVLISQSNNNNNTDNTFPLFLIISIATGLIIYLLYKWTYYIQPDNINDFFRQIFSNIGL